MTAPSDPSGSVTTPDLVLLDVDAEIRKVSAGKKTMDDVTRRLMRERKVSTAEFIKIAEKVAGGKLKSLDTPLLAP